MRAKPAGEQAVAVGDMHLVTLAPTRGTDRAGDHVGPGVDVVLGVAHHRRLAGGATGGVQAHHLLLGHGEHAVGVVVAQVVLAGEGELRQVFQALEVVGVGAALGKALAVQRHVVVGVLQAPAQALQLVLAQGVDTGGFHRVQQGTIGIMVHVHGFTRIVLVRRAVPVAGRAVSVMEAAYTAAFGSVTSRWSEPLRGVR
ncbi:hypothetical protein D3C72_860020 [compost metagenome]